MSKKEELVFNSLYQQYNAMVFQMCLGFVKGYNSIASDITQEVFIKIWNNLSRFRGTSSYKTWIYKITVNTCLEYVRKLKKHYTSLSIDVVDYNLSDETINESKEQNKVLYQAISKLKEIDRLIIMMVLDGQEYEDISEVMGISSGNVRVKIHRIKERLKKELSYE
ncbi:MAG: sigma-70 family RNA polymerase sigma factor [Bacteroidales bacterium]|nr:sigma-70 family RNA polymerase sigma factor [Bacteroidales bacterium]